jgi:phosphoribosylformylglycinamidine synthase
VHLTILIGGVLAPEYFLFPLGLFYMVFGLARATVLGLMERQEPAAPAYDQPADAGGAGDAVPPAATPIERRAGWIDRASQRMMSLCTSGDAREGLLDPQGQAVGHALAALGFAEAAGVRVGRAIELEVAAASRPEAEARVRQMCDKLLANPVTEDYLLEVEEA